MTTIKIEAKPSAAATNALARHAEALYQTPGSRRVAIIELARVGRYQPDEEVDKDSTVNLRLVQLEIASPDQEEYLRQAMLALHLHRTAAGTLMEDQVALDPRTLQEVASHLDRAEVARLRVGLLHWAEQARRALRVPEMSVSEARHELDAIATGLQALLLLVEEQP